MIRIFICIVAVAAVLAGSIDASAAIRPPSDPDRGWAVALSADGGADQPCFCGVLGTCTPSIAADPTSSGIDYGPCLRHPRMVDEARLAGIVPEVPRPPPRLA